MSFSLFVKGFVVLAVIGLLIALGCSNDSSSNTYQCTGGESMCNGECIDTNNDPRNCGQCGNGCTPGALCAGGTCSLTCGMGTTMCGTACADTEVDPKNCGMCGNICGAGYICAGGSCSPQCPAGQMMCSGDAGVSCVTTTTDATNCGGCGNVCAAGMVCLGGSCSNTCGTGEMLCPPATDGGAPYCAAVLNDNNNCGKCGTQCTNGQVCSNGSCGGNCGLSEKLCPGGDGGAAYCAKTDTDQSNCGSCGNVCTGGDICVGGTCKLQCAAGLTLCGKECVDLNYDRDNCSACGSPCGMGLVCAKGKCQASLCGNGVVDSGERCDGSAGLPSGGQITCRPPGSKNECKFDFSAVPQLYCNGTCSWNGGASCNSGNADIYCKLTQGSTTSTASSYTVGTAEAVPGFSCPTYGTNLGTMPEYNVSVNVWYQGTSILANHGAGSIIASAVCTP